MSRDLFPRQRILSLRFEDLAADRVLRLHRRRLEAGHGVHSAEALCRDLPPLAVISRSGNAQRIVSLCDKAWAAGVRRGETLADARGRVPDLWAEEDEKEGDAAFLRAIADWCDRYTPLVALTGLHGPSGEEAGPAQTSSSSRHGDGLFLDITGCSHLFGGEAAMLSDCLARLRAQGLRVTGAVAGTPGAAWALSRYAGERYAEGASESGQVIETGAEAHCLALLPLDCLRLPKDCVADMGRVGLQRVGDLLERDRAPLARRFGEILLLRLDQALGRVDEPISPRFTTPLIMAERRFFEPIGRLEDVQAVVLSLSGQVQASLERRAAGGRIFELALFRVDGAVQRTQVGASRPVKSQPDIARLFAERFKADESVLDAGYGYDLIRLAVMEDQRLDPGQVDWDAQRGGDPAQVAALVDRLGARLGLARVVRPMMGDRHLPESQTVLVPAAASDGVALGWPCDPGGILVQPWQLEGLTDEAGGRRPSPASAAMLSCQASTTAQADATFPMVRPLRLFDPAEVVEVVAMVPDGPPLRFRWRRGAYRIVRSEGPERIAPPWWVGAIDLPGSVRSAEARDYFRVEDEEGRRFWLYREGLYGQERAAPRWFLQGILA